MFFHACAHVLAIPRRPRFLCALICPSALRHGHTCKSPRAAWHIRMSWQTRVHIFWHVYCVFAHVHCDGAHERVLRHAHVYICVHTCAYSKPQPTLGPPPRRPWSQQDPLLPIQLPDYREAILVLPEVLTPIPLPPCSLYGLPSVSSHRWPQAPCHLLQTPSSCTGSFWPS